MKIYKQYLIFYLTLLLISCKDGLHISPGIRSNMYLKEDLHLNTPLDNKIFVKAISLNSSNIESIKDDVNNFTDTKVSKEEVERLYNFD